ncbi:MAG: MBL fold metallo-hydrolase [Eubacterium sp.]|nr:MBL fold metallo-hydrolase [Eubacterium sp.]MCM1303488.1 MBL fold metallo-hydrolase [Butyrivibrio sp.]MCM1342748.1 MBL fold metallo-hydrolase [Muribaculaceae bacterium]MCM1409988.1 MBL fold metallo-hydrolase [Lachnospiraceae bacterium]
METVNNMLTCTLDGNNIKDKETLHDTLAEALRLPDWYGRNLDALYDCLSDIREETDIRLLHEDALRDHLGRYAEALKKTIYDACEENAHIHFMPDTETPEKHLQKEAQQMDLSHITVNTQSSIRIAGSKILYFDPFQIEDPRHDADIIFITHEHFDHFEPDSIAKIKKDDTFLVVPESMQKKVLAESGIAPERCLFLHLDETCGLGDIVIQTVPAYNKLKPFHPKMKKWLGYTVEMDDICYYVSGDTDVNEDIREVSCDVALIPIGGHYTMDRKQAAKYIAELKPGAVIPTHYGSVIGDKEDGRKFESDLKAMAPDIQVELKLS